MIGENGTPVTPDWTFPSYTGICPKCGEHKFIGHGPLCLDCFTHPDESHLIRGEN